MKTMTPLRRLGATLLLALPLAAAASDLPGGLPPNGPPPGADAPPNGVPEPGTWLLVGVAALAAARAGRRRK